MALKPVNQEQFFREVDEELRRSQLTSTWNRFGKWIIAGFVLLLVVIAGVIFWQYLQEKRAGEQAVALNSVFEDAQAQKMNGLEGRLDEIAKKGGSGYRAAALLSKGDLASMKNDAAGAAAAFKSVAEDDGIAQPYRDLALVRQTAAEFDKLPPATVITRLQPLAITGNAFFGSAGEMVALAYLKQNKPAEAARIFAAMAKDETVPKSLRSRATQMAGALGVDALPQSSTKAGATKELTQ